MALKSYKPTTPGQRGLVLIDRSELWKGRPVKSLTEGLTGNGGRNNTGRITMRRRGGGVKRLYRIQGMWTATLGQASVSLWTSPASAIRSQTLRAAPGHGYTWKRVPELP